jgi:hypothetical protein
MQFGKEPRLLAYYRHCGTFLNFHLVNFDQLSSSNHLILLVGRLSPGRTIALNQVK